MERFSFLFFFCLLFLCSIESITLRGSKSVNKYPRVISLISLLQLSENPEQKEKEKEKEQEESVESLSMPLSDPWLQQHINDLRHEQLKSYSLDEKLEKKFKKRLPPPNTGFKPVWFQRGEGDTLSENLIPEAPIIHPAIEPMSPKPGDFAHGLADYDEAPPDPMPPQPPYLTPPTHPGQFDYFVPPAYQAFYPTTAPSEMPLTQPDDCVPVSSVPGLRSTLPKQLQEDDYCIPMKFVPAGYGSDSGTDQMSGSSPQFSLPTPYSHGPAFPPLHPLSSTKLPSVPLPGPPSYENNNSSGGKTPSVPVMPMVPLAPAMWPYA